MDAKKKGISLGQETHARLTAVYEGASADDKARVLEMVRRALGAPASTAAEMFTPGMSALLFHDHNLQNREWAYALTLEYEAMMRSGDWGAATDAIGFCDTGNMLNGQHRLAAVALYGQPITFPVVYGLPITAVELIDTGRRRTPATAVHILRHKEMPEATLKTDIVRKAEIYRAQAAGQKSTLTTTRKIGKALLEREGAIEKAIDLGKRSSVGVAKPTLKVRDAQVQAFIMLQSDWPEDTVLGHLTQLQSGHDVSETSPFFVAAKILERESRGTAFPLMQKLALVTGACKLVEQGQKAVKASSLKDVMKPKHFPDPTYPGGAAAA